MGCLILRWGGMGWVIVGGVGHEIHIMVGWCGWGGSWWAGVR